MQRFQALTEGGAYLRLTPTTTSALAKVPSEACTAAVGCLPSTRIWHRRHYKINANQKRHAMASSIVVSAASALIVLVAPDAFTGGVWFSTTSSGYVGGCTSHHSGNVFMDVAR